MTNVTRTAIAPGITFYHVTGHVQQPGRPWPAGEHVTTDSEQKFLKERGLLRIFGLTIAWSEYSSAVPAASGAPLGILRSLWIYTRRRAYGRGVTVDFAKLQSLEIKVGSMAPVVAENGKFEFHPPIDTAEAPDLEIRIQNRNAVQANGYMRFAGRRRQLKGNQFSLIWGLSGRTNFAVEANTQRTFRATVLPLATVTGIHFTTEPGWRKRITRIYGRPEWVE
jgi:hypothetical protein